jgi:thymidylate synthase ThyX
MKATALAITPPESAKDCPKVTPELLASSLAKYSRSNKGIATILEGIDWSDTDGAVDRIFKFIDYGHASIGGLTGGIAIAVDDCSMFLAYKIFEIAQLVDGQESSTRYITMAPESLSTADELGIPTNLQDEWNSVMAESFEIYNDLYKSLDKKAQDEPEKLLRIPADLPEKVRTRMRKNYALDRARYFIPMATKTSAAYIMTARVWAQVLRELDSLPLKEAKDASAQIREELAKLAPRLIRHSHPDDASKAQAEALMQISKDSVLKNGVETKNIKDEVFFSIDEEFPSFLKAQDNLKAQFAGKTNRYSSMGTDIRRTSVRYAWNNIALAELRDLNRHRSGNRFTPLAPTGFYLPEEIDADKYSDFFSRYASLTKKLADSGNHYYGYLLGTQVGFEHSTNLDKCIYEIELRTGLGAHFRYAEHLDAVAKLLIEKRPDLKEFIEIGTAEPE